jgi:hypothetical protein
VSAPYQYDLPDWPCANHEVETFNRKLLKPMKPFKHVKVAKVGTEREFHTKQGQHMKNTGKEKVALKIAQPVTITLQEQIREPKCFYWKSNQEDKGSQTTREDNNTRRS